MLQAAMDGRGIALGQALIVSDDLAAGRLVAPFQFRLPTGFGYFIVCPQAAVDRPKVKAFREWVIAELRQASNSRISAALSQDSMFGEADSAPPQAVDAYLD